MDEQDKRRKHPNQLILPLTTILTQNATPEKL